MCADLGPISENCRSEIAADSDSRGADRISSKVLINSSSSLQEGLSSDEVRKRLMEYGYNEVVERKGSSVLRFVKKFWGITPWMLEITILLEWILGKYFEMYVVIGLLGFNAVLGFIQ